MQERDPRSYQKKATVREEKQLDKYRIATISTGKTQNTVSDKEIFL